MGLRRVMHGLGLFGGAIHGCRHKARTYLLRGRLFLVTTTGSVQRLTAANGEQKWSYELGDASQVWVYTTPLAMFGRCMSVRIRASWHWIRKAAMSSGEGMTWCQTISSLHQLACCLRRIHCGGILRTTDKPNGTGRRNRQDVMTKAEGKSYGIYSTPVIDNDGTIYTVSASAVRAYGLESGTIKWEAPFTLNRVLATPAAGRWKTVCLHGQRYATCA